MSRTTQSTNYVQVEDYQEGGEFEILPKIIKNEPTEFDNTNRVLLIDGDSLLFSVIYFPEKGTVHFDTDEEYIEEAKYRLREKVQEIHNNVEKWYNIVQTFIFKGGKNNFRYKLYPDYKSNRPKEKPKFFQEIKDYSTELDFISCDGFEADDAIYSSYIACNKQCVIGAIDKDIFAHCWGVPLYDFKTRNEVMGEFKYTTEKESRLARATQYLIGDAGDGVGGAKGIGKAYADKHLHADMTDYQFIKNILTGYLKASKGNMVEAKVNCKLTYNLLRLYTQEEIKSLKFD